MLTDIRNISIFATSHTPLDESFYIHLNKSILSMQKKAIYHFPFDAVHHIGYGADYDCRTGRCP